MELLPNEKIGLGDFYLTYYGEVKQCKRIGDQKKGRVADWNGFTVCKTGEQAYIKIKK
jgi:hypothetical protein